MASASPLRVCYFGTYRANYARNRMMIDGLRQAGVEVIECHETLWQGIEDRVQAASGGWLKPAFWRRVAKTYGRLLRQYRRVGPYDVMVAGYPGQYDVFLARWLSWRRRKPLVWDVLNSMYLVATERGLARRHRFTAFLIRSLEWMACRLPDRLILDAPTFAAWFQKTYKLNPQKFRIVPIGADDRAFAQAARGEGPSIEEAVAKEGPFRVFYYGSYIPNHGVDVIVEAARLLEAEEGIRFELAGAGPCRADAVRLAGQYGLKNLAFIDWLDTPELVGKIKAASVILGSFGDTLQASLTNNNKIYEGFALRKPVISARSPAMPAALVHGRHLYLCERGNPRALAEAILAVRDDPDLCSRLGEAGYQVFQEQFTVARIGAAFAECLREAAAE